jgi:hypothetical protein
METILFKKIQDIFTRGRFLLGKFLHKKLKYSLSQRSYLFV